jgi:tetratricopeptide (TPR) repeat protein
MGPALDRWLKALSVLQTRRLAGSLADPWGAFQTLESQVDGLAVEGLDSRAAAASLIAVERGALMYEQREYEKALQIATTYEPSMPLYGTAHELYEANRQLLIGNVYLVRDANYELAASHFQRAIDASGSTTPFVRGNAAINQGICQVLSGRADAALASYDVAEDAYRQAGRHDKLAVVFQSRGNAYRRLDRLKEGIAALQQALTLHRQHENLTGVWETADDLTRVYLDLAEKNQREFDDLVKAAARLSDVAMEAASEIWNILRDEPGRLADLSDQMIHLTLTRP